MNHNAGRSVGGVREFIRQADVSGGIDARVGGLQMVVDVDPVRPVVLHAGSLEAESVDIGDPSDGQEDLIHHRPCRSDRLVHSQ